MNVLSLHAGEATIRVENPAGTLTLCQALRLALLQNPELAAFDTETRVAEARVLQAGLRPNPTLFLEADNLTGSGAYRDTRQTETTVQLSQLIELGGKRAARLRVAARGRDFAGFDYQAKRLEVLSLTAQAFIQALTTQERIALAEESVRLVEGLVPAIRQLAEAIAAKKLKAAEPHGHALDTLLAALPAKSTDLPEARQKTVAGMVKNADKALDSLDGAVDAGKQNTAEAKLKLLDGVMKILKAQYPPEISGSDRGS